MRNLTQTTAALVTALLLGASLPAAPVDSAELQELRTQIHALETKLLELERRQEMQNERVAVTDKSVALSSADGANSIKFRELVQLDSRLFFNDGGVANNAFVLRRARLIAEGVLAKNYGYQVVTEFGGSSVSILEANFTVALTPALQFRFGRFKEPVGLERLQSDSWTFFNERSIVTNLTPDRDLGVQASGGLLKGRVNYALGVFNGLPDAANNSTNTDFDNDKNVAGRVFASPFKDAVGSPLQGLSFGVGGSFGREKTTSGRTAGYKTDGQQTFFAYNAPVVADGQTWRVSPQLDYRNGSFGALGEYVVSTVNLRPTAAGAKTELKNKAWQLAAGFVLTGGNSSAAGVMPRADFDFTAGTWGAFEVVGRYANLKVDDNAFPLFASVATNADEAKSLGLGLNWYLSKAVAFKIDCYQTKFGFAPGAPAVSTTQTLRQNENAFISRFQLSF